MTTAMDTMKQREKEIQTRVFEGMAEQFFKRWAPDDKYQAAEFDRDMLMLIRQIYRDAQEPLLDRITALASAMPMQFMIPNEKQR